jgi:hypothetical protein
MKLLHFIIWSIIVTSVSGCASFTNLFEHTPIGPKFNLEPNEDSHYGSIYLYRPWRFGSGLATPLITINGEDILLLRNGAYTKIDTAEGKYILETHHAEHWVSGMEDHIVLDPKPKQTYFLRVLPSTGMGTTYFEFSLFDETGALTEISDTDYLNPKKELYQYDQNYTIVCKVRNLPADCKSETKNLKDRSGLGGFVLELVICTGIMMLVFL